MGFKTNKIKYNFFAIWSSYSEFTAYWPMVGLASNWFINKSNSKEDKAIVISGKEWRDDFWQIESKKTPWIKEMLDFGIETKTVDDHGIEISHILDLVYQGYKMILICDLFSINGRAWDNLFKLSCISHLFDVDIRVAIEHDKPVPEKDIKISDLHWGFADRITLVVTDSKDAKRAKYIDCIPKSDGIKLAPTKK